MCEFISWIELADGKIKFLTGDQAFGDHPKSKALREWNKCNDDLRGHGAIRRYYKLANHDGKNRECTDFSTPGNFPDEIAAALRAGKMWGFGGCPKELLTAPALADYNKITAPAWADYTKITAPAFWKIFAVPENRNPKWR